MNRRSAKEEIWMNAARGPLRRRTRRLGSVLRSRRGRMDGRVELSRVPTSLSRAGTATLAARRTTANNLPVSKLFADHALLPEIFHLVGVGGDGPGGQRR